MLLEKFVLHRSIYKCCVVNKSGQGLLGGVELSAVKCSSNMFELFFVIFVRLKNIPPKFTFVHKH